jgi:hypothetical protein
MLSDYFSTVEQAGIFGFIAFLLFFVFFIVITIHTFSMKNKEVERMKRIPFDDDPVPGDE